MRVDLTHPVLFDHPVDHAPGMLLLEAARQATHALPHPRPVIAAAVAAEFTRYVELDAPCWIQVRPVDTRAGSADGTEGAAVHVSAVQNETCAFRAAVVPDPVHRD